MPFSSLENRDDLIEMPVILLVTEMMSTGLLLSVEIAKFPLENWNQPIAYI